MRSSMLLPAVLLASALATLDAQERAAALVPGDWVRVTAPSAATPGCNARSAVVELRRDTLVLGSEPTIRCPISSVERLEVRRGRKHHGWLGAAIGAGALGAAGVAVGIADCAAYWGPCIRTEDEGKFAVGYGTLGVAIGGLLGYAIGSSVKTDWWVEVPLDLLRVGLVTVRPGRRLALAWSLRF